VPIESLGSKRNGASADRHLERLSAASRSALQVRPIVSSPSSADNPAVNGWLALSTLVAPSAPAPSTLTVARATEVAARIGDLADEIDQRRQRWDDQSPQEGSRLPFELVLRHLLGTRHVWHWRASASDPIASHGGVDDTSPVLRPWLDASLTEWAWGDSAVWLSPEAGLYDPDGRQLWVADGDDRRTDTEAKLPIPSEARQRELSIAMQMRNRLIEPVEAVLPIWGASESVPVTPSDAARRLLALFVTAVRAESFVGVEHPAEPSVLTRGRLQSRCPLAMTCLSPEEERFVDHSAPTAALLDRFAWRYEALHTLQWALEMQSSLPWPDERCDLAPVTKLMIDLPHEDLVAHARLRPVAQLADAAELHRQLWWVLATSQGETAAGGSIDGSRSAAAGLDPGVISERLLALAWLLRWLPGGEASLSESKSEAEEGADVPRVLNPFRHTTDGGTDGIAAHWDATEAWLDRGMPLGTAAI